MGAPGDIWHFRVLSWCSLGVPVALLGLRVLSWGYMGVPGAFLDIEALHFQDKCINSTEAPATTNAGASTKRIHG